MKSKNQYQEESLPTSVAIIGLTLIIIFAMLADNLF